MQVLELATISVPYIRFFSSSQIIPDGLLMLFIIFLMYFSFSIGMIGKKEIFNFDKIYLNSLTWKDIVRKIIVVIITICFLLYLLIPVLNELFIKFTFASFFILIASIAFFGKYILRIIMQIIFYMYECKEMKDFILKYPKIKSFVKELSSFILVILMSMLILSPFYIAKYFHKNYFLPNNLANLSSLNKVLNDNKYKSSEIIYFNDKYIFIEHLKNDKNTTIEILKIDQLFN